MNKRDREKLAGIKVAAGLAADQVEDLRQYPHKLQSDYEQVLIQRQNLLDIIDRQNAEISHACKLLEALNDSMKSQLVKLDVIDAASKRMRAKLVDG